MRCPIFRCCRSSSPPPPVKQSVHEAFLRSDFHAAFTILTVKNERDLNDMKTRMCCCKKWYRTYTEQKRWDLVSKYVESQKGTNSYWASVNKDSFPLLKALSGRLDKSRSSIKAQELVQDKDKPIVPQRGQSLVPRTESADESPSIPHHQDSHSLRDLDVNAPDHASEPDKSQESPSPLCFARKDASSDSEDPSPMPILNITQEENVDTGSVSEVALTAEQLKPSPRIPRTRQSAPEVSFEGARPMPKPRTTLSFTYETKL